MKKVNTLSKMMDSGLIAVVRGNSEEEAIKTCELLVEGGIYGLEITFTVPNANNVIRKLTEKFADNDKVIIGAGTILDPISARMAIDSGANFIVSPSFDKEVAVLANLYQVPYTPGCATPTEITEALKYGVDLIKLFPGSSFGPSHIKSLKGPFPDLSIMPSGGVSFENMEEWLEAGAVTLSAGSNLTNPFEGATSEDIVENARKYANQFNQLKQNFQ